MKTAEDRARLLAEMRQHATVMGTQFASARLLAEAADEIEDLSREQDKVAAAMAQPPVLKGLTAKRKRGNITK